MRLFNTIATSSLVAGVLFIPVTPVTAAPRLLQCSELANRFAIGGVNFAENLKCIAGQAEMTYGKYCSRTQGIVCTKARGWS